MMGRDTGGEIRPDKNQATPEAVAGVEKDLVGVTDAVTPAEKKSREGCSAKLATLKKAINVLTDYITNIPEPRKALDAAREWQHVLGKELCQRVTVQATRAWLVTAKETVKAEAFDRAKEQCAALRRNTSVLAHSDEPSIQSALQEVARVGAYCQGQMLLGALAQELKQAGTRPALDTLRGRFSRARDSLKQAVPYQDSERLVGQVTALLEAVKSGASDGEMRRALWTLAKQPNLHASVVALIGQFAPCPKGPAECVQELYRLLGSRDMDSVKFLFAGPSQGELYARQLRPFLELARQVTAKEKGIQVVDKPPGRATVTSHYTLSYQIPQHPRVDSEHRIVWSLVQEDGRWLVENWEVIK